MSDRIERGVERERSQQSANGNGHDPVPDDADFDHPVLRAHKDKLEQRHRQRMRELADKSTELDRQFQQLQATMQMSSQQHHAPGRGSSAATEEGFDWLPPAQRELLRNPEQGPALRELFGAMEKRFGQRDDSRVKQLEDTISKLESQLQHTSQQVTQERYTRQIPQFREKYGTALDEDQMRQVLGYALDRGVDLEDALLNTNRDVFLAQERKRMEREVRERIERDYGASLEAMSDYTSGETRSGEVEVKDGKLESFRETAMRELGPMGMLRAEREGYRNTEASTEG